MIPLISPIPSFSFINFISLIEPITVIISSFSLIPFNQRMNEINSKKKRFIFCLRSWWVKWVWLSCPFTPWISFMGCGLLVMGLTPNSTLISSHSTPPSAVFNKKENEFNGCSSCSLAAEQRKGKGDGTELSKRVKWSSAAQRGGAHNPPISLQKAAHSFIFSFTLFISKINSLAFFNEMAGGCLFISSIWWWLPSHCAHQQLKRLKRN